MDWEKLVQKENDLAAIDRLVEQFSTPLQGAEADVHVIKMEFGSMIEYAVFHAPNSSNALTLVKLLLSLPASNEKLERTIYWVQSTMTSAHMSLINHWMIYCCY